MPLDDELRVLTGPVGPSGAAGPADLPLSVQALAVLAAGEDAGQEAQTDELVAAGLGAVVLFGSALRDLAAAARRAGTLQAAALRSPVGAPLLVGADQEGGRVCRLPLSASTMPAALALGAARDPGLARQAGRATAGQLQAVGVNWDLAPVCDLWTRDNSGLGSRCFSADPEAAAALAAAFTDGLQAGGVLACAKHFPGHGDTAADSHFALPVLAADEALLRAREWVPFAAAVRAGVAGVMLGHLAVPAVEGLPAQEQGLPPRSVRPGTSPPPLPASLSPTFYRLAREALAFEGLLVTDSLGMAGCVRAAGSVGEAAVLALAAGADIVVVGHGPREHREVRDAVVGAVAAGRLPRERLAEAVGRVLAVKRAWNLAHRGAPEPDAVAHLLQRPSDLRLAAEIARRSITELQPGPAAARPAFLRGSEATPPSLVAAASARWPAAEVRGGGGGPWLSLGADTHVLVTLPIPDALPEGRVLLAYDATSASLSALLACAAGEVPAEGRVPRI